MFMEVSGLRLDQIYLLNQRIWVPNLACLMNTASGAAGSSLVSIFARATGHWSPVNIYKALADEILVSGESPKLSQVALCYLMSVC